MAVLLLMDLLVWITLPVLDWMCSNSVDRPPNCAERLIEAVIEWLIVDFFSPDG